MMMLMMVSDGVSASFSDGGRKNVISVHSHYMLYQLYNRHFVVIYRVASINSI